MQSSGWKGFWFGFWVTALVLVPLVGGTVLLEQRQSQARTQVAQDASGVAVALPKAEDRLAALICVPGDEPAFVLVGLDADANRLALLAVPAECAVPFGDGESTLRACYAAAGPARCVQGLNAALAEAARSENAQAEESETTAQIERYLALSAETLAKITADYGPLRVGLSGVLTAQQLAACGQTEAMQEWEASAAHEFLASQQDWLPTTRCALRAAVWEAFFRQKLEKLPTTLPAALRKYSSSLLTDLTAGELYTLEETLEFLADQGAVASGAVLPGMWDEEDGVYRLDAASAAAVQALFSASAASSQSESASAP
jgi:hypothetical protein